MMKICFIYALNLQLKRCDWEFDNSKLHYNSVCVVITLREPDVGASISLS